MTAKASPRFHFSLRARATSWYVGLMAIALLVFSCAIYLGIRTYLNLSLKRALSSTSHTIANDYLDKLGAKGYPWVLGEIRESYESTATDHYIRLSIGNQVLFATSDMRDPSIRISEIPLAETRDSGDAQVRPRIGNILGPPLSKDGDFYRDDISGREVMVYTLPVQAPDGRVIQVEAGASLYAMQQMLRSLIRVLALSSILILILAAIGGYLLMKQPLRPLVVLTEKAANIGRKQLGERLPVPDTGDELERLTHSLNGMIERLEEALNHNHRFSADASHELRTPLTIMRGELEEMLRIENLPQQAVENLLSSLEEIDRMSRIVNSLMTITRLDAGGERMSMRPVDLAALVRTTVEHMRLLAEEKELPLTCSCDQEVYIYGDAMRIKQVLVNLIDNAIKYSQAGQTISEDIEIPSSDADIASLQDQRGGIDVQVYASEKSAILKVTDQGIGIAPEVLPHVFDRFYRAEVSRTRETGGVGLGLAIVKAIVVAHEGMVSISSTPGQGSTVTVELPLFKSKPAILDESVASTRYQPT